MPSRLDHVTITASDLAASSVFYEAALGSLGWARVLELGDEEEDGAEVEVVGWSRPDGQTQLWLVTGTTPTRGLHLAIAAERSVDVAGFHEAAVAAGGRSHDAPRRWALIQRGRFNAIVADPDGNLIEAVSPE